MTCQNRILKQKPSYEMFHRLVPSNRIGYPLSHGVLPAARSAVFGMFPFPPVPVRFS